MFFFPSVYGCFFFLRSPQLRIHYRISARKYYAGMLPSFTVFPRSNGRPRREAFCASSRFSSVMAMFLSSFRLARQDKWKRTGCSLRKTLQVCKCVSVCVCVSAGLRDDPSKGGESNDGLPFLSKIKTVNQWGQCKVWLRFLPSFSVALQSFLPVMAVLF